MTRSTNRDPFQNLVEDGDVDVVLSTGDRKIVIVQPHATTGAPAMDNVEVWEDHQDRYESSLLRQNADERAVVALEMYARIVTGWV